MRPLQSTPLPFTSGAIHNYLRNLLPPSKYYDLVLQNESDFLVGVRQQSFCLLRYQYPSATPLMVDVHYSDSVTYTYADTRERDRGSSVYVDLYILVGGMYKPKATKLSRREPD